MAKTIAELSALHDAMSIRLEIARQEVSDLWEQHERLQATLHTEQQGNARQREELANVRKQLEEERVAHRERDRLLAEARQENAVLRQLVQDHIAQYQEWDRRRWGLIVLLIGTVLTLASGLIVTLAKK